MSRVTSLLTRVLVPAVCLVAAATPIHAVVIFSDGSENSAIGVIPGTGDPTIGDWDFTQNDAASTIRTRTGATTDGPSSAFAGNNYLEVSRGPASQVPQIGAQFSGPVNVTTDSIHAEFQLHFKAASSRSFSASFQDEYQYVPWGDNANQLVPIFFGDPNAVNAGTAVHYWDGNSIELTGQSLIDNAWNHVALDWNAATDQFSVTLNGGTPWVAPVVAGTATSISRLHLWPVSSVTPAGFLDEILVQDSTIPEPSSVSLAVFGVLMLARRRCGHETARSANGVN